MKHIWLPGAVIGTAFLCITAAVAQLPTSGVFSCIAAGSTPACPLGSPYNSLETSNTQFATGAIISVSGYHAVGDNGAGEYVMLGAQSSVCNTFSGSATGSVGLTTLGSFTPSAPTNLTVGELVSSSGSTLKVQPGSEIASITFSGTTITAITLTLPLTGTNGSTSITIPATTRAR